MTQAVPLEHLNKTELLQILSGPAYGYLRLKRSVPTERLVHLIQTYERPQQSEVAGTIVDETGKPGTRVRLQNWVEKNWEFVNSQLPCKGENRGRCTVFPCSEGRHLECFLAAEKHLL